jgi:hypothetical protein
LFLNIGNAQSQTAQAEIHFCRNLDSQGIHILLAVAHVAIIIDLVFIMSPQTNTLKGDEVRSNLSTV